MLASLLVVSMSTVVSSTAFALASLENQERTGGGGTDFNIELTVNSTSAEVSLSPVEKVMSLRSVSRQPASPGSDSHFVAIAGWRFRLSSTVRSVSNCAPKTTLWAVPLSGLALVDKLG